MAICCLACHRATSRAEKKILGGEIMKYTSQQQKALAVGLAARNYHKQVLALVCCGRDSTQQSLTRLPSVGG